MTTLMGQYVGEERRQRPRERTLAPEELMGGGKDGGDGGPSQGKLVGMVFAALVVGGATTYVATINKTAEAVAAMQTRMERIEARTEGQFNLLTLKLETLGGKVDALREEVREDKPRRGRDTSREAQ